MASDSLWSRWRRQLLALFFIAQYHFRLSLLNLRFRARTLSRSDIHAHAREAWHKLCQACASHPGLTTALRNAKNKLENEQVTATLHLARHSLESERLHTALRAAKKRLEDTVFIDEAPTERLDLEALKTAWHSLETSKIQRIMSTRLKTTWHNIATDTTAKQAPQPLKAMRHPWQTLKALRHAKMMLFSLTLFSLFLVALLILNGLAAQIFTTIRATAISTAPQFVTSILNPAEQHAPTINASRALVRLSQLDNNEYASQSEYDTWAYSACSTASMTEVFNAYGHNYRITDVLKVESSIGEITPQLGLVENVGIANTAAQFGFQTTWGNDWTLDQVKRYANAGQPVIVGWPPSRYDGGHIVVVTGGNDSEVFLADSSVWNRQILSDSQFMQWWAGFAAVVTPI